MEQQTLRIFAWNPKGIRSLIDSKDEHLLTFLKEEKPDILFFPETKGSYSSEPITNLKLESIFKSAFPDREYKFVWSYNKQPGWHGNLVAIRDTVKIDKYEYCIDVGGKPEQEGRVITLHIENGPIVVGLYVPNASTKLVRLEYKVEWLQRLGILLDSYRKMTKYPVIVIGDMNVAPDERDICNPTSNLKNPGYSKEERKAYQTYMLSDFVDIWRETHPIIKKSQKQQGSYTFWTTRNGGTARQNNSGWRLDHVLIDKPSWDAKKEQITIKHGTEYIGSDHCPVGIEIAL